ncbi:hypothetical protein U14_05742 [Candidatus Moduliflexus flocculans]|uniref:Permease n=1 Tax=Candidatus Moduliflexus flocculans TaxID=1499966 RepID=A0A081BSS6_9BACT|nr:hypothetical protein U14_05742 [Candidatus Moduliflexus flocculans]
MEKGFLTLLITVIIVAVSALANRQKTWQGVQKGVKMLLKLLPSFLTIIILVSVFLGLIPQETLIKYLGKESGISGMAIAAILGSIALIPGFISYPLGAMLLRNGVSYSVIAVFITTLMMVGVLTLPLEIKYFGVKVSLMRNAFSLFGALLIGVIMGGLL